MQFRIDGAFLIVYHSPCKRNNVLDPIEMERNHTNRHNIHYQGSFHKKNRSTEREKGSFTMEKATVVVIGGGATGVGILRDLAMRGVDVMLVEKRDLINGASSRWPRRSASRKTRSSARSARAASRLRAACSSGSTAMIPTTRNRGSRDARSAALKQSTSH